MDLQSFELTTWLSLLGMALGLYLTYRAQRRAHRRDAEGAATDRRRDAESAAAENATLLAEVKATKEGVFDMRSKIELIAEEQRRQGERLAVVESKAERAHTRMDRIEDRVYGGAG